MTPIKTLMPEAVVALGEHDVSRFLDVTYALGKAVTSGATTWSEHADWARKHASSVIAAHAAFLEWTTDNGHLFYDATGGLEEVERALRRRSQLAFACDLFAGTPAEDVLVGLVSDEYDRDLRDEADRLDVFRPASLPASHTWWKGPSGG